MVQMCINRMDGIYTSLFKWFVFPHGINEYVIFIGIPSNADAHPHPRLTCNLHDFENEIENKIVK